MIEKIREMLDSDPFRAFRIIMTSGDRYEVTNPHLLALGQTEIFYCYPKSDRIAFIRINQIVCVESIAAAA
jgi:hypothetical protein